MYTAWPSFEKMVDDVLTLDDFPAINLARGHCTGYNKKSPSMEENKISNNKCTAAVPVCKGTVL